jgi:hypothetical protein
MAIKGISRNDVDLVLVSRDTQGGDRRVPDRFDRPRMERSRSHATTKGFTEPDSSSWLPRKNVGAAGFARLRLSSRSANGALYVYW